ncbi:MAG: hypothetical protein BGN88_03915 [Clostridiales bacterium 43-6]|nr:MAG: hypothetical protein BGN88_03915 [Clostridiales bacterium 43-6]
MTVYKKYIKRAFDLVLSVCLLPFVLFVVLICGIIIKLEDRGPIFFKQDRVGKDGKIFKVLKLRTMYSHTPPNLATRDICNPDSYITKTGKFLRRWSIDEIPQFLNVVKGDMSIIGPRPLIPQEKEIHILRDKNHVTEIKPGISGWAQVNGRDYVEINQKIACDVFYANNISFILDIKIIFQTAGCVLFGRGYREGKAETMIEYIEIPDAPKIQVVKNDVAARDLAEVINS